MEFKIKIITKSKDESRQQQKMLLSLINIIINIKFKLNVIESP